MSTKPDELNKVIADLRQRIVGKVAMPTDQIEQITLFLFLKQLSAKHDDLVRLGSKSGLIFVGDWSEYHFDKLVRLSGKELVSSCRLAIESLYKNPYIDKTVRQVFDRSFLKILEPKVLSNFLSYLDENFTSDLDLGDFYESLLPILGTQNELGQFRTPRHIIDFIVDVVDPSIDEEIADPACGTAGFLVSSFNYLKNRYVDESGISTLNPDQTKHLYNDAIFGWDMEPLMVKFSLANLYLHGLKVPNVSENDTLLSETIWEKSFDVIVANPPFITPTGGAQRHSKFTIPSNNTEVLFCEWIVKHLNFDGRMGVIVPEGIVFASYKGHQEIRKLLLDNGLWAVVSLPPKVFMPYSGVKTSILFLDKSIKPKSVLFYEIENHGFSLNQNPSPIDANDLPLAKTDLSSFHKSIKDATKFSPKSTSNAKLIAIKELRNNPLTSLSLETYTRVNNQAHSEGIDLASLEGASEELVALFANRSEWKKCTLGDVAKWTSGGTPKAKTREFYGGDIPWVVIGDLNEGIVSTTSQHITQAGVKKSSAKVLPAGTIMFAMYGSIGKTGIMGVPMATNQAIACATPDTKTIDPYFLFYFMQGQKDAFLSAGQGGTQANISQTIIKNWKIILPDLATQKKIVKLIEKKRVVLNDYLSKSNSTKMEIDSIIATFAG